MSGGFGQIIVKKALSIARKVPGSKVVIETSISASDFSSISFNRNQRPPAEPGI